MPEMFKVKEGQRKVKTTLITFFPLLGSVLYLGVTGALTGEALVSALWIPALVAGTGLGFMAGENVAKALERK